MNGQELAAWVFAIGILIFLGVSVFMELFVV